jgi:hypothetical protein
MADSVFVFVREELLPSAFPSTQSVTFHGKIHRGEHSFAANPSHGSEGMAKQDWCMVSMEDGHTCPFHLLIFFELENDLEKEVFLNGTSLKNKGHYALGHYAYEGLRDDGPSHDGHTDDQGNRAHADQHLMHRIPKWHGNESEAGLAATPASPPTLCVLDCEMIHGTCIAFPDILCEDSTNNFFFLKDTQNWDSLFVDAAIEHLRKETAV